MFSYCRTYSLSSTTDRHDSLADHVKGMSLQSDVESLSAEEPFASLGIIDVSLLRNKLF